MARAHLFRPVTNGAGVPLYGAKVTVRATDLSGPISQTVWSGPLNTATSLDNPFTINGGYVDIWLDFPQRVNLLIQQPGAADINIYLDVTAPADQVIQTDQPLRITGAPTAGQVLLAIDDATASFGDPPILPPTGTVPVHQHEGTGANSTAVGSGSVASATGSAAYGTQATASGNEAVAVGYQSSSTGLGSVAIGSGSVAGGDDGVSIGYQAQAAAGSIAIGSGAQSQGTRGTALGANALSQVDGSAAIGYGSQAIATDAVAIGDGAQAQGVDSVAIGAGSVAVYDRSLALGNGVVTTATDQAMIGNSTQTVVFPGQFAAQGDARIGAPGQTLGFFGSYGSAQQVVTGSDGGNLVLRSLIGYLASLGLIVDNTTQG